MAITEQQVVDKIEVLELGQIQVRTRREFVENGVALSSSFHRHVVNPGDSVLNEDARVQAIAGVLWTPEVIAAFQLSQDVSG